MKPRRNSGLLIYNFINDKSSVIPEKKGIPSFLKMDSATSVE